jgi:signal transduction histidine kinase
MRLERDKKTAIRLRWPVVLVVSYLLLSAEHSWLSPLITHLLVVGYVVTNVVLYLVGEKWFQGTSLYSVVVIFDALFTTATLVLSGHAQGDFYQIYFLIIVLCAIWQDSRAVAAIAALATSLYGLSLFAAAEPHGAGPYLRLAFLFVTALFYGCFVRLLRSEKTHREEAERRLDAVEELVEANRLKAEFIANPTHELRTPISVIMGSPTCSPRVPTGRLLRSNSGSWGDSSKTPARCWV